MRKILVHWNETEPSLDEVNDVVDTMMSFGHPMIVTVEKYKKNRTLPQNAYYWKILTLIGEEIGYEQYQMHGIFKDMFLRVSDDKFTRTLSTTNLNVKQMIEYIEKICRFCAMELNYIVPTAEQLQFNN